jgi:hypothetical protein
MRKALGGLVLLSLAFGVSVATAQSTWLEPPPILLKSMAGTQTATQGSYCVSVETDDIGVGMCGDYLDPVPARLSVVRPRFGRIKLILPDTVSLDGSALVERRGCGSRVVRRFALTGTVTRWRVNVRPGVYELSVFARFAMADGRGGDTSGALGLLVDRESKRRIIAARDRLACRAR